MKTIRIGKAHYRLAARLCGNRLFLTSDLRKAVVDEHLHSLGRAVRLKCRADERAFAESVEWERLGDLHLLLGSRPSAVRAYREAAIACLCGEYYDRGDDLFPSRFLRLRFFRMVETAVACCGSDARLRSLLAEDEGLRSEYVRLGGGRE